MNKSFDYMQTVYQANAGKTVKTENYEGVVCGFHFKWDDSDFESVILAIKKVKGIYTGIRYYVKGDAYVTDKQNELGFDFLHLSDIEKLGLTLPPRPVVATRC